MTAFSHSNPSFSIIDGPVLVLHDTTEFTFQRENVRAIGWTRRSVANAKELASLRHRFGVTVTPEDIGGVSCYVVTPGSIRPRNRNRLILNMHPERVYDVCRHRCTKR